MGLSNITDKTNIVTELTEGGIHYKHIRLQHGKDSSIDTLHARPNSWSSAGIFVTIRQTKEASGGMSVTNEPLTIT